MKKLILILIVISISFNLLNAQTTCLEEGIYFTTQAQIDDFATDYPDCSKILGTVNIGAYSNWDTCDITNLNGLSSIQVIGDYLRIADTENLQNLDGLESLDSIGTIPNQDGNFGGLIIGAGPDNRYDDWVYANDSLSNIDGLSGLYYVGGGLSIEYNFLLENLDSLINITSIGGDIRIRNNNNLTDLNGLINITSIGGGIGIVGNENLTDLNGLINITSIVGSISIGSNNSLTVLNGLNNITSIVGLLYIGDNENLTDLNSLINITSIGGDLNISQNNSLSECEVQSICAYLENPSGNVSIFLNATGCNSEEEVLLACNPVGVKEINPKKPISIYPNPSNGNFTVDIGGLEQANLRIINLSGQLIHQESNIVGPLVQLTFDAPSGIYLLILSTNDFNCHTKIHKN